MSQVISPWAFRPSYRVLHVSDTHLSVRQPSGADAWTRLVRYTERMRPDLVVHAGDVVYDEPDNEDDYEFGAFQLRRLCVPWRVIPGNHDIGDSPPDPYHGLITPERVDRFRRYFGADRWVVHFDNWQLIGLNSLLFDNCMPDHEQEQWEWFEEQIDADAERHIAVFMHKPPCVLSLDEDLHINKTIGPVARARFLKLAASGRLRLIGCGHLHEFMTLQTLGVTVVSAPSISMASAGTARLGLGRRCNGAVAYEFHASGFRYRMLEEDELRATPSPVSADLCAT